MKKKELGEKDCIIGSKHNNPGTDRKTNNNKAQVAQFIAGE